MPSRSGRHGSSSRHADPTPRGRTPPNDAGFEGDGDDDWPQTDTGRSDAYQGAPVRVLLKSRKGSDPAEWPEDLRRRELPEGQP